MQTEIQALIRRAIEARKLSYSPYSQYQVGAALLAGDGQIITGCNIENAAYGPSNCAERTAIFKAVSEGIRDFKAIAIVGSPAGEEYRAAALAELFPESFGPENLRDGNPKAF